MIRVRTRIPGDYPPALGREQRKTFWERDIEMPQLVGDTISGSYNGRLVKIPLAKVTSVTRVKVTKVPVPKDVDWGLDDGGVVGELAGDFAGRLLLCMFSYGILC